MEKGIEILICSTAKVTYISYKTVTVETGLQVREITVY